MLTTMPDMKWTVKVKNWTWIYSFTSKGTVSWRDPMNGAHGNGSWRMERNKMITRWVASKTWEEWDMPLSLRGSTGDCHMEEGTYGLYATADYLHPGDVVAAKGKKYVIYEDEVRSGGTVAWVCRNPGNIRNADHLGGYLGKRYQTQSAGAFSIFPDEEIGRKAIIQVLKNYGKVTIAQAINKYAPIGDGKNDPATYGRSVARAVGVKAETLVPSLTPAQFDLFAAEAKRIEGWKEGERFARDSSLLPPEVRERIPSKIPGFTADDLKNTSIGTSW